jgi:hypothetical protein
MRQMEVPAGATPAQAAHDFAKALHERWGVGDAACNNGVLLLLAVENRQVYISTGTGETCFPVCMTCVIAGGRVCLAFCAMRFCIWCGIFLGSSATPLPHPPPATAPPCRLQGCPDRQPHRGHHL